jgi:hypothetical protein
MLWWFSVRNIPDEMLVQTEYRNFLEAAMRLDIERIQNQWVSVIEMPADEKRFKTLFLRQLYAVERVLPFEPPQAQRVSFGSDVEFLVLTVQDVRNNSDA